MVDHCSVTLTRFDENFFRLSHVWLSDPEIKKLTMTPDTTMEEKQKWFDSLPSKDDYCIRGLLFEGRPIGAVGLKHINKDEKKAEYFGYIGDKEFIGKGIGKIMVDRMCDMGRHLQLDYLYLTVADYNTRAYHLYSRQGFIEKKREGNVITMEKQLT